ncbi:MAG: hypothetical protein APF81_14735 [Desulfosporosinus sp. BRH_c37]|nr:MAG: hypothetical protein APF81_14735 [Desulfosporosinus sp. BRH_c37]
MPRFIETTIPKREASERYSPITYENGKIMIDFSNPFVFNTCKIKSRFINRLKNYNNFFEFKRVIFGQALKYFSDYTFEELKKSDDHTHDISQKDKRDLVKIILKEILKDSLNLNSKDLEKALDNHLGNEDIWQVAYKQGVRLIGTRNGSVLKLLFIDYHHLIFPSPKHNDKDYYKYSFCPMTSDVKYKT